VDTHQEPVKVETLLLKICHKKRKDVSSPIMQVSILIFRNNREEYFLSSQRRVKQLGPHLDTVLCMTHMHTHFSFDFQLQCQFEGQAFWHVMLYQLVKLPSMSATIYCSTQQRIWLFVSTILRALHLIRHHFILVMHFVWLYCVCFIYT